MAKEYHITFSCGIFEESSKSAISQIQRLMRDGGAELISKNDDDGFMDIVFHHHSSADKVSSLCNKVIDQFKGGHFSISASVCEHKPSVIIDVKDAKDVDQLKKFVESLAQVHAYTSLEADSKDSTLWKINFEKSSQRQAFQNDFTAKAEEYMTKGHSSVNIFPEWEDITFFQKNNYSEKKRSPKYGS